MIGTGSIAATYVKGLRHTPGFEVAAVCSRDPANATAFATVNKLVARTFAEILADPAINYVLNLTPADAHPAITHACLQAGKSVYSEKPLATTLAEADALISFADQQGLLLACAPATTLWPPLATARRFVIDGTLGSIVGALATLVYPGPETFHANPAQFYSAAAGPLRDMGVYKINALCSLLGPVLSVSAMASRARAERKVRIGTQAGTSFSVDVPTHVTALLQHASGAISTIIVSFDGMSATPPRLELYGDIASLFIENIHRPDAVLSLSRTGLHEQILADGPSWSSADQAIGPTSAWTAFHTGQPFEVSASRARNMLATLLSIEQASLQGVVMNVPPPPTRRPGRLQSSD